MEENKNQETSEIKKNGIVVLCGAFVIGYIIGRSNNKQLVIESYKRGVTDTLNSIIFKHN